MVVFCFRIQHSSAGKLAGGPTYLQKQNKKAYQLRIGSGNDLFKISPNHDFPPPTPPLQKWGVEDHTVLSSLCISESWTGNLLNGIIQLGERATSLHGISKQECGLLSLMRCYDPLDRSNILELFEQASTVASRFCFSTTVTKPNNRRQPVFCTAESSGIEGIYGGVITGIFLFPRFQIVD